MSNRNKGYFICIKKKNTLYATHVVNYSKGTFFFGVPCVILVPRLGIEPVPSAVKVQTEPLDHQGIPYGNIYSTS